VVIDFKGMKEGSPAFLTIFHTQIGFVVFFSIYLLQFVSDVVINIRWKKLQNLFVGDIAGTARELFFIDNLSLDLWFS